MVEKGGKQMNGKTGRKKELAIESKKTLVKQERIVVRYKMKGR